MEGQKIAAISQETINTTERIMEGQKITAISQETIDITDSNENCKANLNGPEKEKASSNNSGGPEHLSGIVFMEDLGNLLKHNFPGNKSDAVAAAESDAEGDGLPQEDNASSSSSSSLLRPKESPDSAKGDGSVESTDDDGEEKRYKERKASSEWRKKRIPIYQRFSDRPDIQVAKVWLSEVDGYCSFAGEVSSKQHDLEGGLEYDIPHVLWPWHGHHVQYMGVKDGREEPLNPILIDWFSFATQLQHIVAKREEDDNLLPVTIYGSNGTKAKTQVHLNFVSSLESFITIIHYICIRLFHEETLAGGNWFPLTEPCPLLDPMEGPSLMGAGTFGISFYDSNERELIAPWNNDEAVDMEEDGGQDENAMDNDEDVDDESHGGGTQSDLSGDGDASHTTTEDIDQAIELRRNEFEEMYASLKSIVIRETET